MTRCVILELVCAMVLVSAGAVWGAEQQALSQQTASQHVSLKDDADRDGLADTFEQALLEKFAPTFLLSEGECDVAPAEFRGGEGNPTVMARNGTIYGQAFPYRETADWIELHYYHLWAKDCGRRGHNRDAEHVSVLLRATDGTNDDVEKMTAVYWYAASHEDTLCEASHGMKASAIGAEHVGATVWISRGKHASFLSPGRCAAGCGGDRCERPVAMVPGRIINLGEPGVPLNGADWIASKRWPLAAKMSSDFGAARIELMDSVESGDVSFRNGQRGTQSVVSAGNKTIDELAMSYANTNASLTDAAARTDSAVNTGAVHAESAVGGALRSTGHSLRNAGSAVRGAFGSTGRFLAPANRQATRDGTRQATQDKSAGGEAEAVQAPR